MRVILIHNHYDSSAPSGESIVFAQEASLLRSNNVEVFLYERNNDDLRNASKVSLGRVALESAWSRRSRKDLRYILDIAKPDVAHFHNTFPLISPSAYAACHDLKIPVVQTLHNYRFVCANGLLLRKGEPCQLCVGRNLLPAIRHRCYRDSIASTAVVVFAVEINRILKTYDTLISQFICLTKFARSIFVRAGLSSSKITVLPNFVLPPISYHSQPRSDFALYVGRLSSEKGVMTLLRAWKDLSQLPLFIVGDGPLYGAAKKYAMDNLPNVNLLGFCTQSKVRQLLRDAAMVIIPSRCYEGFPMVAVEAFASGAPVIASRIGGLAEIIRHEETGLLFSPGDPGDLASSVIRMCGIDRMRMSCAARAHYEKEYSVEAHLAGLLRVYEKCTHNNARGN